MRSAAALWLHGADMKLGFVSAIFPELPLDRVLAFARAEGFACIEAMCWPVGKAERKYAGVTHVDVTALTQAGGDRGKTSSGGYRSLRVALR